MVKFDSATYTSSRPAVVIQGSSMHVMWKGAGDDNRIWRSTSYDSGVTWDREYQTALTASCGPALVTKGSALHIVYNGTDNYLYHSQSDNSAQTWSFPQQIGSLPCTDMPALIVAQNKLMVIFNSGTYLYSAESEDNGSTWVNIAPLYPSIRSKSGPALTTTVNINDSSLEYNLVYRGYDDDALYHSYLRFGNWVITYKIPGASTTEAPTLTTLNNKLIVVFKAYGPNNNTVWTSESTNNGNTWRQVTQILNNDIITPIGPALISLNGVLHLIYREVGGDYGSLCYAFSSDGSTWISLPRLEGQTSESPSLTVYNNIWYLTWKGPGTDTSVYRSTSADQGKTWDSKIVINPQSIKTLSTPVYAIDDGGVHHLAYRGDDNLVTYTRSNDGKDWTSFNKVPMKGGFTSHKPGILLDGSKVLLFWKGASDTIIYRSRNITSNGSEWSDPVKINPDITTQCGPVLAKNKSGKSFLFYVGTNSLDNIYRATADDPMTTWDSILKLDGRSNESPAIAKFNDKFLIVWKAITGLNTLWFSVGSESGDFWTPILQMPGLSTTIGPAIGVGNDGTAHLVTNFSSYLFHTTGAFGLDWSYQTPIQYANSSDKPCLTQTNNRLNLLYKGATGDNTIWTSSSPGLTWDPISQLNPSITTLSGPASSYYESTGVRHLIFRGTDNPQHLYQSSSQNGQAYPSITQLSGLTSGTPALIYANNQFILMWKDINNGTIWRSRSSDNGSKWLDTKQINTGITTKNGPALTVTSDGIQHIIFRGTESSQDSLHYANSKDGGDTWDYMKKLQGGTSETPALVVYHNYLFAVWKGVTNDTKLWFSARSGKDQNSAETWNPQATTGQDSNSGPGLTVCDGILHMVYRKTNQQLYHVIVRDVVSWSTINRIQTKKVYYDPKNWMETLFTTKVGFTFKRLNEMMIPGTHDSGCFDSPFGTGWVANTQESNFREQLDFGIRYFDIRLNYDHIGDNDEWDLYILHTITMYPRFRDFLEAVVSFLLTSPNEFIFVKVNMLEDTGHAYIMFDQAWDYLQHYLITSPPNNQETRTIEYLLQGKGRVIFSLEGNSWIFPLDPKPKPLPYDIPDFFQPFAWYEIKTPWKEEKYGTLQIIKNYLDGPDFSAGDGRIQSYSAYVPNTIPLYGIHCIMNGWVVQTAADTINPWAADWLFLPLWKSSVNITLSDYFTDEYVQRTIIINYMK